MVIVDEVHIAVVDPLMIRDVGVGRVDPHRLGDDFLRRSTLAHQVVIDVTRALLVARQDAILELAVQRLGLWGIADRSLYVVRHPGNSCNGPYRPATARRGPE